MSMSVEELIKELEKAPDKSVDVYLFDCDGMAPIDRVGIDHNMPGVSNKVVIFSL